MNPVFLGLGVLATLFALMYIGGIVRAAVTNARFRDTSTFVVHAVIGAIAVSSAFWFFTLAVQS